MRFSGGSFFSQKAHSGVRELLDRQDQTGKLSRKERREATALTALVDLLSPMWLRAKLAAKNHAHE